MSPSRVRLLGSFAKAGAFETHGATETVSASPLSTTAQEVLRRLAALASGPGLAMHQVAMHFFSIVDPGIFLVRYGTSAELEPDAQTELLTALTAAGRQGVYGIAFDVQTMRVDTAVPNFWLDVVRLEPRLIALAVASPALAVRVTTEAFGIATRARKAPLAVRSFVEVKDALTWVSLQVRLAKAAPPEVWRIQG